jgi:hypothetical protein
MTAQTSETLLSFSGFMPRTILECLCCAKTGCFVKSKLREYKDISIISEFICCVTSYWIGGTSFASVRHGLGFLV